ncbi:DUF6325 family protein [Jatrophihabitans sp. DSM 45814]
MEEFGPVQIMVVGFEHPKFEGEVLPELRRLKDLGMIRLVDLMVVSKGTADDVTAVELSDLTSEESSEFGALVGALIGLGADGLEGAEEGAIVGAESGGSLIGDEGLWSIADEIPAGTTAAVALIEHRWAIPLRDAIRRAGGVPIVDSWIHPEDLVLYGAVAAQAG